MRKYPKGSPVFESIGSDQYNLPFIDETGNENSNIGFECETYKKDSILWFYDAKGLEDGLTKEEVKSLANKLLEIADEMQ